MKMVRKLQIINLLLFSLLILYFNFAAPLNRFDDGWAESQGISWDSIANLYRYWSGRVIAYVLQILMIHHPLVFRIMNSAVMIGMPFLTWMLLDRGRKLRNLTVCVLLFLLYDYTEMRTAGIVTTYVTYYWGLLANILFYIFLRQYLKADSGINAHLFTAIAAGIIAFNSEIGSLLNTAILSAFLIADYCDRRALNKKLLLMLLLAALSLAFFLTCPGLRNRSMSETVTWLPEFSSFTPVYKFYLGFSETLLYYFGDRRPATMLFLLGALLISAGNRVLRKELAAIYVVMILFCLSGFAIVNSSPDGLIVNFSNAGCLKAYLFLAFLLSSFLFMVLIICRLFEDNPRMLLLTLMVMLLGILSRIVVGFSPTLYASATRTFMYCDFALLVTGYLVLNQAKPQASERSMLLITLLAYPYFIRNLLRHLN